MKDILKLIDVKQLLISLFVFVLLVTIFMILFLIPTKKDLIKVKHDNLLLKEKLDVHTKLFPLYAQLIGKLKEVNKSIKFEPKKMTILECVDHIFVTAPSHNLIVLSVNPFVDKALEKDGKLSVSVEMAGKYRDFLKWIEELVRQGILDNVENVVIENSEDRLKINLKFWINV